MPSKKTLSNSSTPARRKPISCTCPRGDHKDPQGNFGEQKLPDNTTSEPVRCRTDVFKTYEVSGGNTTCSKCSENLIHALSYTTDSKTAHDDYLKMMMDDFQVVYRGTYGNGARWMQYYRENKESYMARIKKSRQDDSLGTYTQDERADKRIEDSHPVRSTLVPDGTAEMNRPAILWPADLLPKTLHASHDQEIDPLSYVQIESNHSAIGTKTPSFTQLGYSELNADPMYYVSQDDIGHNRWPDGNIIFENEGYHSHLVFSDQMVSTRPGQDYLQNMNDPKAHPLSMYEHSYLLGQNTNNWTANPNPYLSVDSDIDMPMIIEYPDAEQTLTSHGDIGVSSRNRYCLPTTWDGQYSQISRDGRESNHIHQG